tara:strand:- start:5485 stop:5835 length:351 start_codon:yes stop_codon:yes gene_type:complete
MRQTGLKSRISKKFKPTTAVSNPSKKPAPNLLAQLFDADAPNKKWVTDITCLPTTSGCHLRTEFFPVPAAGDDLLGKHLTTLPRQLFSPIGFLSRNWLFALDLPDFRKFLRNADVY